MHGTWHLNAVQPKSEFQISQTHLNGNVGNNTGQMICK